MKKIKRIIAYLQKAKVNKEANKENLASVCCEETSGKNADATSKPDEEKKIQCEAGYGYLTAVTYPCY